VLQPPVIQVSDQLERRIRKPADALRCIVACIVIIAAVVAFSYAGFNLSSLAIVAGALGFFALAGAAALVAKVLLLVFVVLLILSLVNRAGRGGPVL